MRKTAAGFVGVAVLRCGNGNDVTAPGSVGDDGLRTPFPADAGLRHADGGVTIWDGGTPVSIDGGSQASNDGGALSSVDAGTDGGLGAVDAGGIDAGACRRTAANIQGPFYRRGAPNRTELAPSSEPGDRLTISGRVTGPDCRTAIERAVVDVWQADASGAYDNASTAYRLRGVMLTDAAGRYAFSTVFPGYYLNGANYRPAHIHYTISAPGYRPLTTQLYFQGDPYIPIDPFVLPSLVIPLDKRSTPWRGVFDIVLARL
ncbi:MAG: hypothetical protein HYY84_13630 [Deltaproteobacteria bacterium]|nr:hypothetical protein [Deltaproteobacteria bacterium]